MSEIKELIEKFWSKQSSLEEQHKLLEMINREPAELKSSLKADYDLDLSTGEGKITEKRFQDILARLHARMHTQEVQPKVISLNYWIKLVAALLIVVMASILYFNIAKVAPKRELADNHLKVEKEVLRQPYNSGNSAMIINLSDGSRVTLQPKSSLSYYEPFNSKSRNISMQGEVTFKVAKDKHHPFIVSAGGFTTTALGTEFTISTVHQNRITVKLLEGKVVVKAGPERKMFMKDVYLTPGKQLAINTILKHYNVIDFKDLNKVIKPQRTLSTQVRDTLTFNETPLNEVFSSLSDRYHVNLEYDGIEDAELHKLYFTGSIGAEEKLNTILPVICDMNGLTIKRTANSIIISKQK
ncbi:FecR family protein [Pedobacter psychrotolerans]|uniref:FecR family protein n=1 Tax=Pedobacter psychrotolerans TaxID=1843235 RepID=UPI003F9BC601